MMTMKTMIGNKEMMTIATSVSSSVASTKMKTMISNKEMMTIVTTVSSRETMTTLTTIISSWEMFTITTIAGNNDTMLTISRRTSYHTVDIHVSHICFIISRLRSINAFINFLDSDSLFVSDCDMLCPYVWLNCQTVDLQASRVFFFVISILPVSVVGFVHL